MIWRDRTNRVLFILLALLLLWAFLELVLGGQSVLSQEVRETPSVTTPALTNTPLPTLAPTPTPTGEAPTMDVSCKADRDTWLCTVWVYPGRIAGLEVIAVENHGDWLAIFQQLGDTPDGWGVAVRWKTIPNCSTEFAELQLMEIEPVKPTWPIVPSPVHVRYPVSWHCGFLPVIY